MSRTGDGDHGHDGNQHEQKRLVRIPADGSYLQGSEFQKVLRNIVSSRAAVSLSASI